MREFFEHLDIDEMGEICPKGAPKLMSLSGKVGLYQMSGTSKDVYFVESKQDVVFRDELMDNVIELISMALKRIFIQQKVKKKELILVLGIGNEGLTADSLGAKTLAHLNVTAHAQKRVGKGNLCAFAPGVSGVTGIESFDIVKSLVDTLKPKLIICVDTLATTRVDRLCKIVQLRNAGLTPGAGVGNAKNSFSYDTLGVPVVSIGVPLVIYAKNILIDSLKDSLKSTDHFQLGATIGDMVVTKKEVDLYVDTYAKLIAKAINRVVHGKIQG